MLLCSSTVQYSSMYTCIKHPYLYGLLYLHGYRLYIILPYYVSYYYVSPEPGCPFI